MKVSDVLEKAIAMVDGDRQEAYGSPEDSFGTISKLWTAYFEGNVYFAAYDVAMMMILLKVARDMYNPKEDNYIDIAGYAACADRIVKAEKEDDEKMQGMDSIPPSYYTVLLNHDS
jgi:hypothetical protein